LAQGIFANGTASYPLFIRFSNGAGRGFTTDNNNNKSDSSLDTRGMAIKLFQVPGTKLVEPNAETQDFLMTVSPMSFLRNYELSEGFFAAVQGGLVQEGLFLAQHPRTAGLLVKFGLDGRIADLLQPAYWSQAPYQFGDKQAKFKATPVYCNSRQARDPRSFFSTVSNSDFNYLRERLVQDLQSEYACFNFSVQFYSNEKDTPIDDTTVLWNTPFYNVGTIVIPMQTFGTPGQEKLCRQMAFNPWNSVKEHQPLGFVGRLRQVVYTKTQAQRHKYKSEPNTQPTIKDWVTYPRL